MLVIVEHLFIENNFVIESETDKDSGHLCLKPTGVTGLVCPHLYGDKRFYLNIVTLQKLCTVFDHLSVSTAKLDLVIRIELQHGMSEMLQTILYHDSSQVSLFITFHELAEEEL